MAKKRNVLAEGLMGAVLGGLNFKFNEETRRQMEEAELRKEQRLAAIRAAEAERAQQFQLQRDEAQNAAADARLDKQHDQQGQILDKQQAQQLNVLDRQQAHQTALADKQLAGQIQMEGMRAGNALALSRENNAAAMERQRALAEARGTAGKAIIGSDGNTYEFGEQLPDGVVPLGGFGTSWAPPATRQGAGLMGGAAAGNGAASRKPPAANFVWDAQQGKLVPAQ